MTYPSWFQSFALFVGKSIDAITPSDAYILKLSLLLLVVSFFSLLITTCLWFVWGCLEKVYSHILRKYVYMNKILVLLIFIIVYFYYRQQVRFNTHNLILLNEQVPPFVSVDYRAENFMKQALHAARTNADWIVESSTSEVIGRRLSIWLNSIDHDVLRYGIVPSEDYQKWQVLYHDLRRIESSGVLDPLEVWIGVFKSEMTRYLIYHFIS